MLFPQSRSCVLSTNFPPLPSLRHPIHYHNTTAAGNPWRRAILVYVIPATVSTIVANATKGMELMVVKDEVPREVWDEVENKTVMVRERSSECVYHYEQSTNE